MLADVFCQNFITKSLSWMHTKTRKSIINEARSLLKGQTYLSLSSIGRNLPGKAKVTHKINRCWRFLSHKKLSQNQVALYKSLFKDMLTGLNELLIAVD